jgi:Flp pilus assembly protein TadD
VDEKHEKHDRVIMDATTRQKQRATFPKVGGKSGLERLCFVVLSLLVIGYAFLAGFRTLTEYDLGWLLATGRWIAEHRQLPSTDVFSYTAQGQPWVYPVGAGLLFYGAYLLGGYPLLSWLGAVACAGTTALLVWRRSLSSTALAILAVPLIAIRTRPRADMFTVLLFVAFLTLLWQHHQTGRARLWLLPILMMFWVNLHLGFVAGLALIAGYVLVETLEAPWPERRKRAVERLRASWPWLIATFGATLVNPWGWRIFDALLHQESAMAAQLQWIPEWGSAQLNWTLMVLSLSLRNPGGAFHLMLLIAAAAVAVALLRRQLGAAGLLSGAAAVAFRHIRFEALFASTTVVVAGSVLTSALAVLPEKIKQARLASLRCSAGLRVAIGLFAAGLTGLRSADLVTDRSYLASTDLGAFGTGLSWWFPARAAAFVEREQLPGQIFNSYNEGGYVTWRLGQRYRDYVDGRALPFGAGLVARNNQLMGMPPESPEWQRETADYDINTILVPLGRYNGLHLFPVLRRFCSSAVWRPVYLDEVSAVFVRVRPENERLIDRLQIQCATAPLPAVARPGNTTEAFNQWANAAAVLQALGRNAEAFEAINRALAIFPNSAFVHFLRGNLLEQARNLDEAEQEYRLSAALEPNGATWSTLATIYRRQGRLTEAIDAWERASDLLRYPGPELLALGYADLAARRPQSALQAFESAAANLPPRPEMAGGISFLGELAHGRATAWSALGDSQRAVSFAEEAVRLRPERSQDWLELANLYDRAQRFEDAKRARARAAALIRAQEPPNGQRQER